MRLAGNGVSFGVRYGGLLDGKGDLLHIVDNFVDQFLGFGLWIWRNAPGIPSSRDRGLGFLLWLFGCSSSSGVSFWRDIGFQYFDGIWANYHFTSYQPFCQLFQRLCHEFVMIRAYGKVSIPAHGRVSITAHGKV